MQGLKLNYVSKRGNWGRFLQRLIKIRIWMRNDIYVFYGMSVIDALT